MAKYTPITPSSFLSVRAELDKISTAIEACVQKSKSTSNAMEGDLDMNDYTISNAYVAGVALDTLLGDISTALTSLNTAVTEANEEVTSAKEAVDKIISYVTTTTNAALEVANAANTAAETVVELVTDELGVLEQVAIANVTDLDDVAYLNEGTVSSVHYFYYTTDGTTYYNSDGVTGEITAYSVDDDTATLTIDDSSVTLTKCYDGATIRDTLDTNASNIATNTTDIADNLSESRGGLSFEFEEDSTSTSTAYVWTSQSGNATITEYVDGQIYRGPIALSNTTAKPTLSIDGLTAYKIYDSEGAIPYIGGLTADSYIAVRYDSTKGGFKLLSATPTQAVTGEDNTSFITPYTHLTALETYLSTNGYTSSIMYNNCAHLRNEQTSGTGAGASVASTWNTKTVNTSVLNKITDYVALDTDTSTITLQPARYLIRIIGQGMRSGKTRLALYNSTESSYDMYGASTYLAPTYGDSVTLIMEGYLDVTEETEYLLKQYTASAYAYGLGYPSSVATEYYDDIWIWKVGDASSISTL